MIKHICDSCHKAFDSSEIKRRYLIEGLFYLGKDVTAVLPFDFTIELTTMKFCTTGLDFCRDCTIDAIKHAVSEMK